MSLVRKFIYTHIARPVLFSFSPDQAHDMIVRFLWLAGGVPGIPQTVESFSVERHPELEVELEGLRFSSPVGLAAGLDKNGRVVPMMKAIGFGFVTVGTVTARQDKGNVKPWLYSLPNSDALVVNTGLANDGMKKVLTRLERMARPIRQEYPKVLSLAPTNDALAFDDATCIEELLGAVKTAGHSSTIQAIELNISCPHVLNGERFTKPALLDELLRRMAEQKPKKIMYVKMPIDSTWPATKKLIEVIKKYPFITGLTFGSLRKDRTNLQLSDPLPSDVIGALSGAPTREKSTQLLEKTYREYGDRFVLIGVGGVLSAEDAYEKIKAGASFVELITGVIMHGPQLVEDINKGLVRLLREDGYTHITQAIGANSK